MKEYTQFLNKFFETFGKIPNAEEKIGQAKKEMKDVFNSLQETIKSFLNSEITAKKENKAKADAKLSLEEANKEEMHVVKK